MARHASMDVEMPYQLARRRDTTRRRGRSWFLQELDTATGCWRDIAGPYVDSISAVRRADSLARVRRDMTERDMTPDGDAASSDARDITEGDITLDDDDDARAGA